jgi:hypothetical protein
MSDATRRLSQVTAWSQARAFAVISEAVWWVTIVDATLVAITWKPTMPS